ncbi:hypothetical protein FB451DRAFT_1285650 [Mycena latifolia]|nr:hypothetical protein FB451DRAFT_1285650 [Mycena latifolia]
MRRALRTHPETSVTHRRIEARLRRRLPPRPTPRAHVSSSTPICATAPRRTLSASRSSACTYISLCAGRRSLRLPLRCSSARTMGTRAPPAVPGFPRPLSYCVRAGPQPRRLPFVAARSRPRRGPGVSPSVSRRQLIVGAPALRDTCLRPAAAQSRLFFAFLPLPSAAARLHRWLGATSRFVSLRPPPTPCRLPCALPASASCTSAPCLAPPASVPPSSHASRLLFAQLWHTRIRAQTKPQAREWTMAYRDAPRLARRTHPQLLPILARASSSLSFPRPHQRLPRLPWPACCSPVSRARLVRAHHVCLFQRRPSSALLPRSSASPFFTPHARCAAPPPFSAPSPSAPSPWAVRYEGRPTALCGGGGERCALRAPRLRAVARGFAGRVSPRAGWMDGGGAVVAGRADDVVTALLPIISPPAPRPPLHANA